MAGHSKWANIKHRKGAQDAKRGKIFTKLIREITVSAKLGGGDESSNPRLRAAIAAALSQNMTKDTVQRAVKRGAGTGEADDLIEVCYEGYGVNGVAVLVYCLTDNRNRTVAEVRHAFSKHGGNLGTEGSVAFQFRKVGVLVVAAGSSEDKVMELALEYDPEDIEVQEDGRIVCEVASECVFDLKQTLEDAGLVVDEAEVTMLPSNRIELSDDQGEKLMRMIDVMEDLDDVQNVYHNAD